MDAGARVEEIALADSAYQGGFGIYDAPEINAFATPGGYVFITSGLYRLLENEAALAGVIGHEMTHVNERHYVKLLQQQRALALGREFLLGQVKNATVQQLAGNGVELTFRCGASWEVESWVAGWRGWVTFTTYTFGPFAPISWRCRPTWISCRITRGGRHGSCDRSKSCWRNSSILLTPRCRWNAPSASKGRC